MLLFSLLLFVFLNIFLGMLVFFRNWRNSANISFFLLTISTDSWLITNFLADHANTLELGVFWNRATMASGIFIIYFLFYFISAFIKEDKRTNIIKKILFVPTIFLVIISFLTDQVVQSIVFRNNVAEVIFGNLSYVYLIFFVTVLFSALIVLVVKYNKSFGSARTRLTFLFAGLIISFFIATFTNLILPLSFNIYTLSPYGAYATIFLIAFTAYAIIKHRLMDIRLLVVKSIVYFLLFLFIAFIYTFFAIIIGVLLFKQDLQPSTFWPPLAVALVVGFTLHPLRRAFTKWTDKIFFKDRYDFEDLTKKLNEVATSTIILSELLFRFLNNLLEDMRITRGTFILLENNKVYESESVGYKEVIDLEPDDIKHLLKHKKTEIFDEVPEGSKCKDIMRKYNASLIFQLRTEGEIVGFLILGEKKSGDIYTAQDIKVLEIITAQLALGVQNAKAYEKVQKFNVILKAEIDRATKELRDVNERLREADKAKDEFISMASHEIRTPIATLEGYLSILNGQKLQAEEFKDIAKRSYESVDRLSTLVKDLLDVSRLDQKRIQIKKEPTRLERLIEHVVESFELRARDKGIYLKFKKPEKMFPEINMDVDRIEEVFNNLVGNSIKFTDKGGITISLSKKGKDVVVSVSDTGQGIPKDSVPNLFKKFYQAQTASSVLSNEKGGTGLGLYITKNIVDMHGGKIWVESAWKKGTTFYFTLPV